jgi:hypothetical protein
LTLGHFVKRYHFQNFIQFKLNCQTVKANLTQAKSQRCLLAFSLVSQEMLLHNFQTADVGHFVFDRKWISLKRKINYFQGAFLAPIG